MFSRKESTHRKFVATDEQKVGRGALAIGDDGEAQIFVGALRELVRSGDPWRLFGCGGERGGMGVEKRRIGWLLAYQA
jgi:hypothetical protein